VRVKFFAYLKAQREQMLSDSGIRPRDQIALRTGLKAEAAIKASKDVTIETDVD